MSASELATANEEVARLRRLLGRVCIDYPTAADRNLLAAAKRLLRAMDDYDGDVPSSIDSPYMRMKDAVAAVESQSASRRGGEC